MILKKSKIAAFGVTQNMVSNTLVRWWEKIYSKFKIVKLNIFQKLSFIVRVISS